MLGRVKPRGSCQPSLCSRVLTHRELHSFSCYLRVSKGRHLWELWRPENFASLFLSCWVLKSCLYWIQMHSGGGEEPGCYYIPFGAPQTPACPCPFRLRVHCSFQNVTQVTELKHERFATFLPTSYEGKLYQPLSKVENAFFGLLTLTQKVVVV